MRKRLFILFVFLISLTGCAKTTIKTFNNYIGVAIVDMVVAKNESAPTLNLSIFSSGDIKNIAIEPTNGVLNAQVQRHQEIKIIDNGQNYSGILHQVTLVLNNEAMVLNNINISYNNTKEKVNIGTYRLIEINNVENVYATIQTFKNDNGYRFDLIVQNDSTRDIYLQKISNYQKASVHELQIEAVDKATSCVFTDQMIIYPNIYFNPSKGYYQVAGVMVMDYLTNLNSLNIYASYYLNLMPTILQLKTNGIDTYYLSK